MLATRTIRIRADLAEMLAALTRHDAVRSHALLDPILRPHVESLFRRLPDTDRRYAEERIARISSPSPTTS